MRHYADEVIWAGNDEQGFVTSHRALNIGRHTGHWRWGPPTGRKVNTWVIANCVSGDNEIFEEWVLYNLAAQLDQLGIDVAAAARAHGNSGALRPLAEREITEVDRLKGGQKPSPYPAQRGTGFDVDHFVRALLHDTFNRRDLSAIDRAYAQSVRWYGTTNRSGYGRGEVKAMARSLLSTFPDLGLHVDEVYWMGNEREGFRVSVRWTALGTHRGWSLYGEPTGRRVHLWALQQLYIHGGRIVEDWMLFNEFDVLAQILKDDPEPFIAFPGHAGRVTADLGGRGIRTSGSWPPSWRSWSVHDDRFMSADRAAGWRCGVQPCVDDWGHWRCGCGRGDDHRASRAGHRWLRVRQSRGGCRRGDGLRRRAVRRLVRCGPSVRLGGHRRLRRVRR